MIAQSLSIVKRPARGDNEAPVPNTLSRRDFLKRAVTLGAFAAGFGAIPAARKAGDLWQQHQAWAEASRPNAEFFDRHAVDLARLTLGGSFAPEQWPRDEAGQRRALTALDLSVRELGTRQLRLGLRWNRVAPGAEVDLTPYRPYLDYCFANGVDLCLNLGPIRVFRWPEEHLPAGLTLPPEGSTIDLGSPLADAALDYLNRLLVALRGEYGATLDTVRLVQVENEPFFALGARRWRLSQDYVAAVAHAVSAAMPHAGLLVTSAGRLNLEEVRRLFLRLQAEEPRLAGRLVTGFDFHYKTPLRDSYPVVRYFDQIAYGGAFVAGPTRHVWDSRDLGFAIEVSEAQAEPYGKFQTPGNSARDFRFLLLRCLDKVLDPQLPALIRLWGLERLSERMLGGDLTAEHRDIIQIIQTVNQVQPQRVTT
jgi:hypothetical protein